MRGPAAEAEAAAGQLGGDVVDGDRQAGGQPLDDDDEGRAVGFAGGQVAQHGANLLAGPPPANDLAGPAAGASSAVDQSVEDRSR